MPEDADEHWAGEDDEQARRFGWYPRRSSIEQVQSFLLETEREWSTNSARRSWAIRDAATRALVGGCQARLEEDGSAHLSWWIFPQHRRHGYASRGVRLMLPQAAEILAVHRFIAFVEPDNLASLGVARRIGMADCGMDLSGDKPMVRYELLLTSTSG